MKNKALAFWRFLKQVARFSNQAICSHPVIVTSNEDVADNTAFTKFAFCGACGKDLRVTVTNHKHFPSYIGFDHWVHKNLRRD